MCEHPFVKETTILYIILGIYGFGFLSLTGNSLRMVLENLALLMHLIVLMLSVFSFYEVDILIDVTCEISVTFGAKGMGTLEKYERRLDKEWRPLGWSLELR